jgi:hypothetical protein
MNGAAMQPYLKALYGATFAALASAQGAYVATGHIGWLAGFTIAGAFLGGFAVIWGVPNAQK